MTSTEQLVVRLENLVSLQAGSIAAMQADIRALKDALNRQQLGGLGGGDGGEAPHQYLARSDGAAQASGTWPSGLTPDTFTSDVLDIVTGEVVATGVAVEWWNTDALTTDGALVWCDKKPDGTYVGRVEQCNAIAEDE